jgi:glutathione S-transferase
MTLTLHEHPFASYCWKPLIALYELGLDFERNYVGGPEDREKLAELWPIAKIPVLVDDERELMLPESTTIIEHLDELAGGDRLVPSGPEAALQARLWDRIFDNFVMTPMQKVVIDSLRPDGEHDDFGVAEARSDLHAAYRMLDAHFAQNTWAGGERFTLAECAAAPALFYARVLEMWDASELPNLDRYWNDLRARESVKRVIDEAREYRQFFPLPWPDGID